MSHLVHTGDFNLDIDIIGLLKRDYKDGNKSSYSVACCISHVTGTIFESANSLSTWLDISKSLPCNIG